VKRIVGKQRERQVDYDKRQKPSARTVHAPAEAK